MTKNPLIDWYWQHGVLRKDEYALSRGHWLDDVYAIAERRAKLDSLDMAEGAKKALGVWGPSQTGKSTLLSRYLDVGRVAQGSPCLSWDESSPTVFLNFQGRAEDTVVLNPFNNENDGTGCVTRYTLAEQVRHPRHPVSVRLNSLGDIMHAFACGYLSECKVEEVDGAEVEWDADSFKAAFLAAQLDKEAMVSQQAYELLREVLRIVELFVSARHARYRKLAKDWDKLRRKMLNECTSLRSVDDVIRLAKRLFWDDVLPISAVFDRVRAKEARLNWSGSKVYCTTQVAALLMDIDTFRRSKKAVKNADDERVAKAIERLGFRKQGGDILIEVFNESVEIAGDNFGLLQALVREVVVPVRKPADKTDADSAFFRLLSAADLLDFPGVANQHANASEPTLINPRTTQDDHPRWLTAVFKRGKTESMVLGYAKDVTVDAFALLVKAQTFPPRPKQLTAGIEHWWKCVDPDYKASDAAPGTKAPLPLSICLTFFAKVVNQRQIGSGAGLESVFGHEMLGQLAPLTLPGNSRLFATTYNQFEVSGGKILGTAEEIAHRADIIRKDAAFRQAFRDEVSRESFDQMIAEEDGGVEFFLEQQVAAVNSSPRRAKLSSLDSRDRVRLLELIEEAVPSGSNEGAEQARVIRKVAEHLASGRSTIPDANRPDLRFRELESADSLFAYWIRLLSFVDEAELDPVPKSFSQHNPEFRRNYVNNQWKNWMQSALVRLRTSPGFEWSQLGLDGENEGTLFLRYLSEQLGSQCLYEWIQKELDDISSDVVARSARREIAVAMGNIIRGGSHHLPDRANPDPLALLRAQLDQRGFAGTTASPYDLAVTDGFLALLRSFRPSLAKRPPQCGDDEMNRLRRNY